MNLSQKGISIKSPEFQKVASEIQGNILKSHARNLTTLIFFRFQEGKEKHAKKFIRNFSRKGHVTSAAKQMEDSAAYKLNPRKQRKFVSLLLTAKGYNFLQIPSDRTPDNSSFRKGMEGSGSRLKDPPKNNLETAFQEEIHGMILVARGSKSGKRGNLNRTVKSYISKLEAQGLATIITIEEGDGIKNKNGDDIEHFGYVDGISQPRFFLEDIEKLNQKNIGIDVWNPLMPTNLVLVDDPGSSKPNSFGSYFVFRKMEQNVKGFKEAKKELAQDLFGTTSTEKQVELAGALMMGRFKNGMPVTMSDDAGSLHGQAVNPKEVGKINNFNYSEDSMASKCPFHSHVRKTNPRGEHQKRHMMARRGIPYGHRNKDFSDEPTGNVGLLFMSYQSNLNAQFEFIQSSWSNNNHFPRPNVGIDPITGQGAVTPNSQSYARKYGDASTISPAKSFGNFVTHKGGEYFFAPSIDFLKNI